MSWLKYGTIGAIIGATAVVGAALLFGDSEESTHFSDSYSFDDLENELEDENTVNPETVPEA